jgi:hypothetical protein
MPCEAAETVTFTLVQYCETPDKPCKPETSTGRLLKHQSPPRAGFVFLYKLPRTLWRGDSSPLGCKAAPQASRLHPSQSLQQIPPQILNILNPH